MVWVSNLQMRRQPGLVFLASAILLLALVPALNLPIVHSSPGSWNPKVPCTPIIVRITDITANQTQQASYNASPFTPGITTTVTNGQAKRWLTPGPTPPGWVSPGPPCTVTNSKGTTSLFVEIDGVGRNDLTNEDWSNLFDTTNGGTSHSATTGDTTFNLFDPAMVPHYYTSCTSASDPTCYGRIHAEIDHDWKASGYCGAGTVCDNATLASQTTAATTLIDVQGFVSWDPGNLNASWHQFNGWEIHPLTGWRLHQTPLNVGFTHAPPSPVTGQTVTFNGTASGGASPYTFTWRFGDGATGTGNPATHIYNTAASYTVNLSVVDSNGATGASSATVTVGPSPTTDFNISSNPSSLTIQSGTQGTSTINLSSLNGFSGTVSLSAGVSQSGLSASLSPASVGLSSGGSGSSTLTVSSSAVGTYSVTVSGTSGSLSHTTRVAVTVTGASDFDMSSNPSALTEQAGSSASSTISLSSVNGFSGTISLTASVSPSGPSASLNPTSVTLSSGSVGSSVLTFTSSTEGTYTVTIAGASGSLSHSTTVVVTATPPPDFDISANPTSLALAAGSSGTTTLSLSSLNGYTGTVSLTTSVTATDLTSSFSLFYPTASLNPSSVPLSAGASGTATLTVDTSSLTLPGTYAVTVTATDGNITHAVTVYVTVGLVLGL